MAEWKMNRMLSSIWGKLEEKRDQRKLLKYKNWCALVDKKCASTLYALKALECADMDKKEKLTMVTNKVIVGVNELIALLTTTAYKHDTSILNANPSLQDAIRSALLDVWSPLLTSLPKLEFIDVTVVTQIHKAILLLMCREEFSCEALSSAYAKDSANKEFILRYRNLLHLTLQTATQRLLDKHVIPAGSLQYAGPMNAMLNISFVAKVLAILFWRLPHVGAAISQILEVPNMELIAPVLSFPAFPEDACVLESPRGTNNNGASTTTSTSSANSHSTTSQTTTSTSGDAPSSPTKSSHITPPKASRGSSLLGWAALFKDLPPLHDDATVLLASPSLPSIPAPPVSSSSPPSSPSSSPPASPLLPPPTTWLGVLAKFDTTYVTFFKEWILHVKSVLGRVEWSTVPGFPRLLQSLLYQMRTKEQPPPPLSKPYPLLDLQYTLLQQTNAELIDAFVKAAFLRTNVFDLLSVLNTLHLLEGWFNELLSHELVLPPTFDINFFSSGIDILLKSDHHQIVLRSIMLIYTFSEMFENAHRACLFDLLLSKYFYTLFMHWDPGVRNAFHQMLVFKMVRIKRSTLYNDGYVVKELSQVGLTSHQARDAQDSLSKSGSGFFSTFSNVLPAFFSLSNSPDKSPSSTPPSHEALSSSPAPDGHANGAQPVAKDTQGQGQENTHAKGGNEKPTSNHNNNNDNLEDGFVELSNSKSAERRGTVGGDPDAKGRTPAPNDEIDVQLFLKLNSYLKTIEDQLRKPTAKKVFEARLEPYGPIALAEFNQHLARYHQWELKNEEPPRFMSLPFARMGEG